MRSDAANAYCTLYGTKHWKTLRRHGTNTNANTAAAVRICKWVGITRSAVVHHLKPHKGDLGLFFDLDNLQSVCWTCHSGDIQLTEELGYDSTIGADGWPTYPKHPYVT